MRTITVGLAMGLTACSFRPAGDGGDPGGDADPAAVDARAVDAAGVDAAGFDLGRCPGSYDPPRGGSRYRLRPNPGGIAGHAADCDGDSAGLTHLVVVSDPAEADALVAWLCPGPDCIQQWTGAYAGDGFTFATVTGEPGYYRWDVDQPLDFDTSPTAVEFNLGADAMTDLFMFHAQAEYGAICECDGRTPSPFPSLAPAPPP